jgi:hypothetical protein
VPGDALGFTEACSGLAAGWGEGVVVVTVADEAGEAVAVLVLSHVLSEPGVGVAVAVGLALQTASVRARLGLAVGVRFCAGIVVEGVA